MELTSSQKQEINRLYTKHKEIIENIKVETHSVFQIGKSGIQFVLSNYNYKNYTNSSRYYVYKEECFSETDTPSHFYKLNFSLTENHIPKVKDSEGINETGFRCDLQGRIGSFNNYQVQKDGIIGGKTSYACVLAGDNIPADVIANLMNRSLRSANLEKYIKITVYELSIQSLNRYEVINCCLNNIIEDNYDSHFKELKGYKSILKFYRETDNYFVKQI